MNHEHRAIDLSSDTNFVFFFSPKDDTELLIHQGEWFYVYQIEFDEESKMPKAHPLEYRRNHWIDYTYDVGGDEGPLVGSEL